MIFLTFNEEGMANNAQCTKVSCKLCITSSFGEVSSQTCRGSVIRISRGNLVTSNRLAVSPMTPLRRDPHGPHNSVFTLEYSNSFYSRVLVLTAQSRQHVTKFRVTLVGQTLIHLWKCWKLFFLTCNSWIFLVSLLWNCWNCFLNHLTTYCVPWVPWHPLVNVLYTPWLLEQTRGV